MGVFFYRGDSCGEGGSGNLWLSDKEHVHEICEKLINKGLMVLDGSDGAYYHKKPYGEYCGFWKWKGEKFTNSSEIKSVCGDFTDKKGNKFTCVGYAGIRYGNTLMWQLSKASLLAL